MLLSDPFITPHQLIKNLSCRKVVCSLWSLTFSTVCGALWKKALTWITSITHREIKECIIYWTFKLFDNHRYWQIDLEMSVEALPGLHFKQINISTLNSVRLSVLKWSNTKISSFWHLSQQFIDNKWFFIWQNLSHLPSLFCLRKRELKQLH